MDALVAWMRERGGLEFEARAYVDTGPVQERVYAQYAGLGWIGKNTCVINPEIGSWLFLSGDHLQPAARTGRARARSVRHLPPVPRLLPDRRHRRSLRRGCHALPVVPDDRGQGGDPDRGPRVARPPRLRLRHLPGGLPLECDARAPRRARRGSPWLPRAAFDGRSIAELWRTPDTELRASLKNSAMTRAGVLGLRRNVAVCAGATGDADALSALREVHEPTCDDPIVAEHIHWALELSD